MAVARALEVGERDHASGRILGRVQDHELRPLAEKALELGGIEAEAAILPKRQGHRGRACEPDGRLVDRKAGIGIDHLVAGP